MSHCNLLLLLLLRRSSCNTSINPLHGLSNSRSEGKKRRSSSTCSKTKWKLKRIMKTLELILSWILNRFLNLSLHVIIININLHSITVVIVVTHCCRHHLDSRVGRSLEVDAMEHFISSVVSPHDPDKHDWSPGKVIICQDLQLSLVLSHTTSQSL